MRFKPFLLRNTYWMKDYLKGSPIKSHYNEIKSIMECPNDGPLKRKELLSKILYYATQNSIFYKEYEERDLSAFPVMNKLKLLEKFKEIEIPINKIPKQKGEIFIQKTSGSTGIPFAVPQNTIKRNRRIAELKYFGEKSGFKSHENLIHLRSWNRWQNKSKIQSLRENIIPFNITNIDDSKLSELCRIIKDNKSQAVRGYASSIDLLVRYIIENKIKLPSLKILIAVSEALQDETRELVEENLNCDIISQYSNEENGILAQERGLIDISHLFYLNHASYFFEILKFNRDKRADIGELGRIVITDFYNYAFPMIRYDTGDIGMMGEPTEHSNGYPVLKKLYGRRIDLIFGKGGQIIHPMSIARTLKHYREIKQWQFIQNNVNEYLLKITTINPNFKWDKILLEFQTLLGADAQIKIQFTDDIPVLSSGKRKSVVNNWKI